MYLPLNKTGVSNARTDETIYQCPSLVPKSNPSFSPFYPSLDYQNREYFSSNQAQNDIPDERNQSNEFPISNDESSKVQYHIQENYSLSPKNEMEDEEKNATLLPVMDCKFNFREICKQCILLEDHLTHNEKRCIDCCMKHF